MHKSDLRTSQMLVLQVPLLMCLSLFVHRQHELRLYLLFTQHFSTGLVKGFIQKGARQNAAKLPENYILAEAEAATSGTGADDGFWGDSFAHGCKTSAGQWREYSGHSRAPL